MPRRPCSCLAAIACAALVTSACGGSNTIPADPDGGARDGSEAGGRDARPAGEAVVEVLLDEGRTDDAALYAAGTTAYRWATVWSHPLAADSVERYLAEARPGVVLLEVAWPRNDSPTPPAESEWDPFLTGLYQPVLEDILGAGGTVMLQVPGPPKWASSAPDNDDPVQASGGPAIWSRTAPAPGPAGDYPQWSSALSQLAGWITSEFSGEVTEGRVWIGYGVELDNHEYYADIHTYAPALAAAASAIHEVDPGLRVGGGGRLNAFQVKTEPAAHRDLTAPVLETWLADCEAAGCEIDFIFGHNFTVSPVPWGIETDAMGITSAYGDLVTTVQNVASRHDYGSAQIVLTDWTSWELHDRAMVHPWLSSEHDTEYRAAYTAASLIDMRRVGMGAHTLGTLWEQAGITGDFIGDWGLFTNTGITKPVFHAAAMASSLQDSELHQVRVDDARAPFVFAEAGVDGTQLRVLISRFVPDTSGRVLDDPPGHRLLVEALASRLLADGYTPAALQSELGLDNLGDVARTIIQIADDHDYSSTPGLAPQTRALFDAWFALDNAAATAPRSRTVPVRLTGLPEGAVLVGHYRVSSTLSNSYTYCIRDGNDCSDAMSVNDGAGGRQAVVNNQPLSGADPVIPLEMERHQVDLLVVEVP